MPGVTEFFPSHIRRGLHGGGGVPGGGGLPSGWSLAGREEECGQDVRAEDVGGTMWGVEKAGLAGAEALVRG